MEKKGRSRPMRRKFPTRRDLPKGCGVFASRFKLDKDAEHLEGGTKTLDQAIGCGLKKENPVVSSLQLDEPTLSNDDLANTPILDRTFLGRPMRRRFPTRRDLPKGCGRYKLDITDPDCANKSAEGNLPNGRGQQALPVDDRKRKLADIVQADSEGNAKFPPENKRGMYIALPEKSNHHQVSTKTKATVVKEESRDAVKVERTSGLVHPEVQSLGTKPLDMSTVQDALQGDYNRLTISSDWKEVPECPWRSDE